MTRFVLMVCLALAPAIAGAAPPSVSYAKGRVTAHLDASDPTETLVAIAREAHLEIRGTPTTSSPVTLTLDAVPLGEALPRILSGQSFTLTYAGERVKGVRLLGGSESAITFTPPEPPASLGETPDLGESGALAASHRSVPIGGRLARAVGADRTDFSQIMGVALRDGDARTRSDALRVGLRILDDEPELCASVLAALDNTDDAALAGWLARAAGDHAEEVARRAATTARSGALRLRAAAVVRRLEATPERRAER